MVKVTKLKNYRLNFTYNGKHYSINDRSEFGEHCAAIICKEDKDFYVGLGWNNTLDAISMMFKHTDGWAWKYGETFNEKIDMDKLELFAKEVIEDGKKYEDTTLYLSWKCKVLKEQIDDYDKKLDEMKKKLKEYKEKFNG